VTVPAIAEVQATVFFGIATLASYGQRRSMALNTSSTIETLIMIIRELRAGNSGC
jgi:low affinity Fe/Cu permease